LFGKTPIFAEAVFLHRLAKISIAACTRFFALCNAKAPP